MSKGQLQPKMVDKTLLEGKEERRIEKQKMNFDKHHGTRDLAELEKGQDVWITDKRVTGRVIERSPFPRSYLVQSGKRVYRRNRKNLIPSPNFQPEIEPDEDLDSFPDHHLPDAELITPVKQSAIQLSNSPGKPVPMQYTTRSGRTVRPPERLNL